MSPTTITLTHPAATEGSVDWATIFQIIAGFAAVFVQVEPVVLNIISAAGAKPIVATSTPAA